jgi:membrane fusion protein (multidrug efflux system)
MKSLKIIGVIVTIVIVLGLIKAFVFTPKADSKNSGAPGGAAAAPTTAVTVFVVKAQELDNNVFATGTILANEEVVLAAEISGKIVLLKINEGGPVHKGDLLVKINDADYQAQLEKMELAYKIANEKLSRLKQLLAINAVSQEEYDVALNLASTAKADVDFTRAMIAKTEIRAPFNGIVGLKYVSEGSYINAATRIATIQQVNPVKVDFSVPEKYASILSRNDIITFTVSDDNKKYHAKVYAIEPKIDQTTRTIQIRALADNSKNELFAGSFTKIELPLHKIDHALMIPTEAIIPILKGKKIFVCKDGKAKEVIVETGIRNDQQVQIVSGIAEGDSVITTGIMQLKNGVPVKIMNPNNQ